MIKSRKKFLLFLLFTVFFGCEKKVERLEESRFAFGTYFKIVDYTKDKKRSEKNIENAFKEINRIDSRYNSKVKGSLVDILNTTGRSTFDEEGVYLLNEVTKAYNISNKKYDITMAPLLETWGFEVGKERKTLPSEEELSKAMEKVDYSKVKIDNKGKIYFEKQGMEIDTGSFLKGYAIEKAKESLEKNGETNLLITSVSSIAAIGGKNKNIPWTIGIQNPEKPEEILGTVELKNQCMGVSGDYQIYVEIEGKRYHHIINKETKYPESSKKMVVVVTDNAFYADLYSTTFFLMDKEKVLKIANENKNLEVLIVDKNNKIFTSKDLKFKKKM